MFLGRMKAFLWSWILCLGCGEESSAVGERPRVVLNAVLGTEVTFPVQISHGFEFGDIIWLIKDSNLAELTEEKKLKVRDGRFQARVSIDFQTGSLRIWNLTFNDSGDYNAEIYKKGSYVDKEVMKCTLRIFDRVRARVNISAEIGTCNVILNCSENDGNNVTFDWSKEHVKTSLEPSLNVTLTESESKLEVCCQVKNPASTSKKCVIPWEETIEGFNRSNCTPSGHLHTSQMLRPYYVAAPAAIVLVAAGMVVFVILLRKNRKDLKDKTECQTVYATVNKPMEQGKNARNSGEVEKSKNATQEENCYPQTGELHGSPTVKTVYAEVRNTQKEKGPNARNSGEVEKSKNATQEENCYSQTGKPLGSSTVETVYAEVQNTQKLTGWKGVAEVEIV